MSRPLRRLRRAVAALLACAILAPARDGHADPPPAPPAPPTPSTPAAPAPEETPGARALLAGEDPGFGSSVPELGEPPPRGLAGKQIRRIEVVTAGGRWATSPAVTSVHPGDFATPEAARRILREVLASAPIARANVEVLVEEGGVVLRVNVLPRRIIADIRITGGALDHAEALDAAGIAVGRELTAPQLAEVPARLRAHYERHGYPAADARADTTDTDDPGSVVLSIIVVPGKPRTVRKRIFVIDPAADREVGDLKTAYRVPAGARVDEPALADADRDLAESLRQHGFFRADVRHTLRHVTDPGAAPASYLYIHLTPGPRYVPAFDGNRAIDAGDLEQALNLEKAPEYRAGELTDRLRAFYVARGFLDAEVSMVDKGKPGDAVHYLAFTVREHRQVRVAPPVFPCLTGELSEDDLRREIGSFLEEDLPGADTFSPPDPRAVLRIFGPTAGAGGRGAPADLQPLATYAPETYDRALKHLKDLYHSKGYLNAVVGPVSVLRATCSKRSPAGQCIPLPPKEPIETRCLADSLGMPVPEAPVPDSTRCQPDPARGVECATEITVRIPVAVGPKTTLWDLAFEGNRTMPGAELAKIAALPLGLPISSVELETARVRVLDAYRKRGFAYAEVRTNAEPSPDRTRARIRFYVTEREPVTVTGFTVKGNTRTDERLILRRVALKKDDFYKQDLARQTEERIATLGTFSSVSVGLQDADVPERQKRVVITVVENPSQFLEARPGFSTGDGVRGSFEWGHRNLGGQAIALTLRVQLSYLFDFLILDKDVLANYQSKLSAPAKRLERRDSVSFNFPEIGLGPLVRFSVDAIDLRDNQRDYSITKEAIVPAVTYRPFRWMSTQLGVSVEYNDVTILNREALSNTTNLLRAPEGTTVALAQRLNFTYDGRDAPLNATRGVFFSTTVEHVNAFPVGSESHTLTRADTGTFPALFSPVETPTSHFLRFTGRVAGYIRLTDKGMALAFSLGAGYNKQLFEGSKTYPDRLFFLGGVDSMRAFLADSLMPEDLAEPLLKIKDPTKQLAAVQNIALRGGDAVINPRAELRVPITDVWNVGLFFDSGNVWLDPTKIDLSLRYALGAGLRFTTPVGPLAFDYGFNLNRRPWEDVGAFHFSIGLF